MQLLTLRRLNQQMRPIAARAALHRRGGRSQQFQPVGDGFGQRSRGIEKGGGASAWGMSMIVGQPHPLKGTPVRSAVDAEIAAVGGQHSVGFFLSSQPDQAGIGQIDALVGVAIAECRDQRMEIRRGFHRIATVQRPDRIQSQK